MGMGTEEDIWIESVYGCAWSQWINTSKQACLLPTTDECFRCAFLMHSIDVVTNLYQHHTSDRFFCLHRFFWAARFLIFVFSLFFVSGPCARLSWPSRQLLSARKSISYPIVSYRMMNRKLEDGLRRPSVDVDAFAHTYLNQVVTP